MKLESPIWMSASIVLLRMRPQIFMYFPAFKAGVSLSTASQSVMSLYSW